MSFKKSIYWILVMIWMLVIFFFSSKPIYESKEMSLGLGKVVGKIFIFNFDHFNDQEKKIFAESIDYTIRKTAHCTEYAILAILFIFALKNHKIRRVEFYSFFYSTIYAGSDEIHQFFVPGRSSKFTDVLIDSVGVIIGIILYKVWLYYKEKKDTCNLCEN